MQNSDFWSRITSVYGSQTSSVVLSTHNSVLSTRIKRQYGFQPSPVVLCMQTATLALELLISIVPCPHLRFLHANQRLLEQNYKSVWDPDHTCRLCMQDSVISTWITSLYGSLPSSAVFACKTATFGAELQVCMGPRPHLSFCACKSAWLAP